MVINSTLRVSARPEPYGSTLALCHCTMQRAASFLTRTPLVCPKLYVKMKGINQQNTIICIQASGSKSTLISETRKKNKNTEIQIESTIALPKRDKLSRLHVGSEKVDPVQTYTGLNRKRFCSSPVQACLFQWLSGEERCCTASRKAQQSAVSAAPRRITLPCCFF